MQTWMQNYVPQGSLAVSALLALIPVLVFFVTLAGLRLKAHVAGAITVAISVVIAIACFGMPTGMAFTSAIYGFAYGLWPISWIIIAAVFLYRIVVKTGQFDIIRSSVVSLTDDQRLQMLLIGFSFGAFLEGAAGFGAPVAITAALLVGLGFEPLYAAGLCLIANTAPVAFGAMGIPIIVAGKVSGIDPFHIGAMAGRQLPLLSMFVPFWLVFVMDGKRGLKETWPAALVAGGSFAVAQYFTSNHIGPELPDIISSLFSLVCLASFLRVWQPRSAKQRAGNEVVVGAGGAAALGGFGGGAGSGRVASPYTPAQILRAWSPFLVLTMVVTIWSLPAFKGLFGPHGALAWASPMIHVPGLDNLVIKGAPVVAKPTPMGAEFKFDFLSATGTAILISALISMVILRMKPIDGLRNFGATLVELKYPVLAIGLVLSFAFVMNYSGMSTTLALMLAGTGAAFPFFSPILGWMGVFLTGSDTSSNALFGALQSTTAHQVGVSKVLMVAANSTGGVTGKMISPQSIAVACAATGLVGKESDLFRFTFKHSLLFVVLAGLITMAQAYWLTGMVVH